MSKSFPALQVSEHNEVLTNLRSAIKEMVKLEIEEILLQMPGSGPYLEALRKMTVFESHAFRDICNKSLWHAHNSGYARKNSETK
jgi:hypothetical protein